MDRALFYRINRDLANGLFDRIFPIITNGKVWIIPLIIGAVLYLKYGKRGALAVLLLALGLVAVANLLATGLIKPLVHRIRPCDPRAGLEGVRCLIGILTSWSFPSSHSVNSFTLAAFIAVLYPRRRVILIFFSIALTVGFSRIYVGVHYPADVIGGALIGAGLGLGYAGLSRKFILSRIKS